MYPWWALVWGCIGALGAEFALHIFPRRFATRLPAFMTGRFYWLVVLVATAFGGLIAFAYAVDQPIKWYVALNIGATWPLIFQQGAKRTPKPTADNVD